MEIATQTELSAPLKTVFGPLDYKEHRELLVKADEILRESGVEDNAIINWLTARDFEFPSDKEIKRVHRKFRCCILKSLSGLDYRELAMRIADSDLYRWFAGYNTWNSPATPSKSTLERYITSFDIREIENVIVMLNQAMSDPQKALELLDKENPVNYDIVFADSTCLKANIHFPVDWVLLRDSVRSLAKAIICIRKQGLLHRIPTPEGFITKANTLSIEMTQIRRKKDAAKHRKRILRKMKKLNNVIERHAIRYRDMLLEQWQKTELSEKQAKQIVARIDNILEKLPQAIKQAHERIIGGRKVAATDKILSLYDDHAHIIVRGKAGAEVEFGNGLYLAEQENGLIVDWQLFEDQPPSDSNIVPESIKRITERHDKIQSFTTDRGFSSQKNNDLLDDEHIFNGTCPKSPAELELRSQELRFIDLQKRRAQTEGRIGIFKNVFLGKPMASRNITKKKHLVNWAVLTHNLWVLSRMAIEEAKKKKLAQVA